MSYLYQSTTSFWTFATLLTFLNVVCFLPWPVDNASSHSSLATRSSSRIESSPSKYINLQQLSTNTTTYKGSIFENASLYGYPTVALPNNTQSYNMDVRRHWTKFGTVSSDPRNYVVSRKREISTILQFKTSEFGMEKCAIQLGLPAVRNMNYIDPGLSNDTSLPRSITLDIHIAHFSTWINSGRTVEPLEAVNTAEFLDTLTMGAGNHELSKTFECKEGVLVSVIISCASKTGGSDSERECELDVWMDRTEFTHGFVLIQMSTLS